MGRTGGPWGRHEDHGDIMRTMGTSWGRGGEHVSGAPQCLGGPCQAPGTWGGHGGSWGRHGDVGTSWVTWGHGGKHGSGARQHLGGPASRHVSDQGHRGDMGGPWGHPGDILGDMGTSWGRGGEHGSGGLQDLGGPCPPPRE